MLVLKSEQIMRQWIPYVFAGLMGGMVTLAGSQLINNRTQPVSQPQQPSLARAVNFTRVPASSGYFDFSAAAEKSMPAVVNITATIDPNAGKSSNQRRNSFGDNFFGFPFDNSPQKGTGSGVIYSEDGYIITNNHVVEGATELEVTLYDNRTFRAKLIGRDKKSDLAVIKIETNNLPAIEIGDSDAAKVGEWALAVGNPFDLTSTVTAGIISAKGRNIELLGGGDAIEAFIQTDAAVNPGNSGGALVDINGKLIGINTAIATRTGSFQGYSFAIPIDLARKVVDDIINYGSYKRAFLGVTIRELDTEYAKELKVNLSQGVVVETLVDGGSAQYAGIQPSDIITNINNREVKSVPELQEVVGRSKVGDTVNLTVLRKGRSIEIPVKLRESNQ